MAGVVTLQAKDEKVWRLQGQKSTWIIDPRKGLLGAGGEARVYESFDVSNRNQRVAVKILDNAEEHDDPVLFHELEVLAKINSPHVVAIRDHGRFEEAGRLRFFIVMDYRDGSTMAQIIQGRPEGCNPKDLVRGEGADRTPLPYFSLDEWGYVFKQICSGLGAAHNQNVIHRDIKPKNIIVNLNTKEASIIDFGVARIGIDSSHTIVKGTMPYLAPEVLIDHRQTRFSDIYALAVTFYEALTGRCPFLRAGRNADTAGRLTEDAIKSYFAPPCFELPSAAIQDPDELRALLVAYLIHKGMAKDPDQRPKTADEFSKSLTKALSGRDSETIRRILDLEMRVKSIGDRLKATGDTAKVEALAQCSKELLELQQSGDICVGMTELRAAVDKQLGLCAKTMCKVGPIVQAFDMVRELLSRDPDDEGLISLHQELDVKKKAGAIERKIEEAQRHLQGSQLDFVAAESALHEALEIGGNLVVFRLLVEIDLRRCQNEIIQASSTRLKGLVDDAYEHQRYFDLLCWSEALIAILPDSTDARTLYQTALDRERRVHESVTSVINDISRGNFGEARRRVEALQATDPLHPVCDVLTTFIELTTGSADRAFDLKLGEWEVARLLWYEHPVLSRIAKVVDFKKRSDAQAIVLEAEVRLLELFLQKQEFAKAKAFRDRRGSQNPGLSAFDTEIDEGIKRSPELEQVLREAWGHRADGQLDDCVTMLKDIGVPPHNPMFLKLLVDTLYRGANLAFPNDLSRASMLVSEALQFDEGHQLSRKLERDISREKDLRRLKDIVSRANDLRGALSDEMGR